MRILNTRIKYEEELNVDVRPLDPFMPKMLWQYTATKEGWVRLGLFYSKLPTSSPIRQANAVSKI